MGESVDVLGGDLCRIWAQCVSISELEGSQIWINPSPRVGSICVLKGSHLGWVRCPAGQRYEWTSPQSCLLGLLRHSRVGSISSIFQLWPFQSWAQTSHLKSFLVQLSKSQKGNGGEKREEVSTCLAVGSHAEAGGEGLVLA